MCIMKWRLSTTSADQKEIADDKKSMSYIVTHNDVSKADNKSPTKTLETNTSQKYKPRSSNGSTIVDQSSHNTHFQYQLSPEEVFRSGASEKHGSDGNIFVISSNQTGPTASPASDSPQSAEQTPVTNVTGVPVNDSNFNAMILENYGDGANINNDFHYVSAATITNPSSHGSLNKNGSTSKLLPVNDDPSTQTKCSIFRGLILCLCLNVSFSNIVRFPRELDKYGFAFLIPYLILLLLVGLPILLLEVSIGQFLGQGSANSWRASPIFKGASIASRFASWLAAIWISMQAVISIVYIGMLIFKSVPFIECAVGVKIIQNGYQEYGKSGQECIQKNILTPVWDDAIFFAFLAFALIFVWIIVMGCTHNGKVFRRTSFMTGLIGFALLISLTGWEVHKSLMHQYFPQLWIFEGSQLAYSTIWFSALTQVIYSTTIGLGVIPVITGKFLYKGDAVRTSVVYMCFNLLINAISVTLFMVQYDNPTTRNLTTPPLEELKPLTAVYDKILYEKGDITTKLIPGLIYALIVVSCVVTISVAIFTSSRIASRHPNYILSIIALMIAVGSLVAPKFMVGRLLDTRIVPTLVITSLVFDLIATTWIYGAKNIYTDLEFSIGRPIFKLWIALWCFAPVILTGLLVWWCVDDDQLDLLNIYIPRWGPIVLVLAIIVVIACIEIFKQVDYNFFGMICEAAKPAKEWGPADPLARHAWKQWRSVCQDTGRKDFTLRRRGTRDYTHSIKRGQYSNAKYGTQNWKSSTPGSSSPNYSGSVFGDSAIEEDMSVSKYSGVNPQYPPYTPEQSARGTTPRYSNRSRRRSINERKGHLGPDRHKEIVYIRRNSNESSGNGTKIEITPATDSPVYARNPLARSSVLQNNRYILNSPKDNPRMKSMNPDHICWRKFSVNSEEYSTEL